ncbi:methylated-DNA--[protein]-cysteine S-methyltransferase [Capnocytophaga canimorsus]|uniref:methylated-DNA--[protein]-cysteine S-methyltransferase n=1 Tax=Capnocytophaga canimorsus TaxID=28188 RepID=UPI0037CFACA6
MENKLIAKYIQTPLGKMMGIFTQNGLCILEYTDKKTFQKDITSLNKEIIFTENELTLLLETEIENYFKGELKEFSIPLDLTGTPFQQKVWRILQQIPYGKTISYKEQAQKYRDNKAIRAIASANGKNKISIIIPCHRVIGSDGNLIGYAGGIWRKKKLLELEQNTINYQTKLF